MRPDLFYIAAMILLLNQLAILCGPKINLILELNLSFMFTNFGQILKKVAYLPMSSMLRSMVGLPLVPPGNRREKTESKLNHYQMFS